MLKPIGAPNSQDARASAERQKRRVLMLCYLYPPVQSSGTARSVAFSSLLPRFGWEPTVLTVRHARDRWSTRGGDPPADVVVVRTPEWDLAGAVNLIYGVLCRIHRAMRRPPPRFFGFPDAQAAWLTTLPGALLARSHDVVYASCSPFSSALSALAIGALARKPVVLDFRDAWCYDLDQYFMPWHVRAVSRLERLAVERCDRLIVNTDGARRLYEARYPWCRGKLHTIPNGYDRLTPVAAMDPSRFRIVHVGTLYGGRDPRPLLRALCRLNDSRIEFVNVGEPYPGLESHVPGLTVRQLGILPREAALQQLQQASLLYLRQGSSNTIAVAAKTYEYLATGLPILCHCPPGDNVELVRAYGKNAVIVTSDDDGDLATAVRSILDRWPNLRPEISPEFKSRFSREVLTQELSEVLELGRRGRR